MTNLLALPEWFNPWGILAICALIIIVAIIVIILCVKKDKSAVKSSKSDEQVEDDTQTSSEQQTEMSVSYGDETSEETDTKAEPLSRKRKRR
jgi:uncharacterized protein YxeA